MKLSELTEAQKKEFTEQFYFVADSRLDDLDTPTPWGCPWIWCEFESQKAQSVTELATEFWINHQDDIIEELDKHEKECNDLREEYKNRKYLDKVFNKVLVELKRLNMNSNIKIDDRIIFNDYDEKIKFRYSLSTKNYSDENKKQNVNAFDSKDSFLVSDCREEIRVNEMIEFLSGALSVLKII